jgi:hypothetical protein
MDFTNSPIDENTLLEKLSSMICGLLVISLPMGLLKAKAHKNKYYPLHFIGISIGEYDISPIEKPYVIPSVIFFSPSVFLSANLIYN